MKKAKRITRKSIGDPWGIRSLYVVEYANLQSEPKQWYCSTKAHRRKQDAEIQRKGMRNLFKSDHEWRTHTRIALYVRAEG